MKLHIIINPSAGSDQPVLAVLNRVLSGAGVDWSVSVTQRRDDGFHAAQTAIAEGVDRVVVFGGDGTVSEVARAMASSALPMAILPGGTGNVVAQEVGVPLDLEEAVQLAVATDARVRVLDGMRVGERTYLQRIGVGAEARAILGASRADKTNQGWLAYVRHGMAQLGAGPQRFSITADGEQLELDAVTCTVANCGVLGRGGVRLADGIDPSDGVLDLLLLERSGIAGVGALGLSSLGWGGERRSPAEGLGPGPLHRLGARTISIACDPAQPAHGDGDAIHDAAGDPPASLSIEVAPEFVRLLVP